MNRRDFAKTCLTCATGPILASAVIGCSSVHYTAGTVEPNGISVKLSDFRYMKKDQELIRQYIIVRNDKLEYPIYLFRFSEDTYSALLMRCTHQGNELHASGDHLYCSAHGSEFSNKGIVEQGPAEKNLRSFPVSTAGEKIMIDLRA
jgi:Rieske Fe-S protein